MMVLEIAAGVALGIGAVLSIPFVIGFFWEKLDTHRYKAEYRRRTGFSPW